MKYILITNELLKDENIKNEYFVFRGYVCKRLEIHEKGWDCLQFGEVYKIKSVLDKIEYENKNKKFIEITEG